MREEGRVGRLLLFPLPSSLFFPLPHVQHFLFEADAEAGPTRYGAFGMDWRTTSPEQWLEAVTSQAPLSMPPPSDRHSNELVVLKREDFDAAVRRALRDLDRPTGLHDNPLLQTRLVVRRAGPDAAHADRVSELRGLVREAAEAMANSPRDARYHRALQVTYLKPAPSQGVAAERLGLPFSTFRRHLQRGVNHVAEALWRIETAL